VIAYYLQCNWRVLYSLAVFGAISRKRRVRRGIDGYAEFVIGPDVPRAGRGIGRGVGVRSAGSLGGARLVRLRDPSIGVSFNWRVSDCTLRGPDGGRSNGYRLFEDVRESYGCSVGNAYSRSWICSLRKSSTLDGERERSLLVFGNVRKYARQRSKTLNRSGFR